MNTYWVIENVPNQKLELLELKYKLSRSQTGYLPCH